MTVWLVLLLAGGGSLLGGEPVPEADSIVLGLTPVLSVSDRTDAAGEEDGFYVYSELGFRLVWGGIAVYLDFGVDKLRPYLMDDQGNRLVSTACSKRSTTFRHGDGNWRRSIRR